MVLKSGFSSFFNTIKTGEVVVDGNTEKLKGTGKAAFIAKGSFGLLGASVSRLFAALGPLMIAFTILAPFLPTIAKKIGLISEESEALKKSFGRLTEQQEKLAERFKIQTTAIQNTALSYVEIRKANLAYNKTQVETSKLVQQARKDFIEFERNLTGFGKIWDNFKSIFGLDAESKLIKAELNTVKDTLDAALRTDAGEETLKIFENAGVDIDNFSKATGRAMSASSELEISEKRLEGTTRARMAALDDFQSKESQRSDNAIEYQKNLLGITDAEMRYIKAIREDKSATANLTKERGKLSIEEQQATDILTANGKLTEDQVAAEAKRVSALESSKEAVAKFQSAFVQTTKVDDITSSLKQLRDTVVNSTDIQAAEDFFDTFDKEPVALLFTKKQIKEIQDGGEGAKVVFNGVVDEFENIRSSIAQSKNALKNLTAEAKQYSIASRVGGEAAAKQSSIETSIAAKKAEVGELNFKSLLFTQGLGEADAERLSKMTSIKEIQAEATRLGKDDIDLHAIKNGFIEKELTDQDALFTANTENLRLKQDQATAAQAILTVGKEALKLEQESVKLAAQKAQFTRTGATTLTEDQSFDLEVQAQRDSLSLAKEEADIKKSLIDVEYGLLAERVKITFAEGAERTKMLASIGTAQTNAKNNVDKAISNAEDKIGVTVMDGFAKGLSQASGRRCTRGP